MDTLLPLILPALAANMAPIPAAKLWPRFSKPIDGGSGWLGPNKTWRGLLAAAGAGFGTGGVLMLWPQTVLPGWLLPLFGAYVALAAMAGDMAGSLIKRKVLHLAAGRPCFGLDQLDYVLAVLLATCWLPWQTYEIIIIFAIALVGNPLINALAWRLGLKKHWW